MNKLSEKKKLIIIIASAVTALAVVTFALIIILGTPVARTSDGDKVKEPYSMTVDGKEVMLLKSKADGQSALDYAVRTYTPDGLTFKSVEYDKKIEFKPRKFKLFEKPLTVRTEEEAAMEIIEKNLDEIPMFTATVTSEKYKEKDIEPGVRFKYVDDMGIYEYKVKKKAKKGRKRTRYEWVTENGKITSKERKETEVTVKPVAAVVETGYEEAPDDLKWKDYKKYQKVVEAEYGDYMVGDEMVAYGKTHLGAPYKVGGKSYKTGIDCVQFVRDVYRKFGINLPGRRSDLAHVGKGVSLKDAKPGDIVYYGNHVAMYIGDGKIIHATYKGISIRNVDYRKFSTIRHIDKKKKKKS